MDLTDLADSERYISLATYRKNGQEVLTPVWFAREGDSLYVLTLGDSGKVKRLRNSGRSRVAACNMRGRVHGEWIDTTTRIVDKTEEPAAHRLLRRKYGWQVMLGDLGAKLRGSFKRRVYLEIRDRDGEPS